MADTHDNLAGRITETISGMITDRARNSVQHFMKYSGHSSRCTPHGS
jgi:hypothetical protein